MCLCGCENGGKEVKKKKEKAFLICPVRGHEMSELEELVAALDEQYDLHWPHRDTNQSGDTGLTICWDNYNAIKDADIVLMVWNGESYGSHFDLGVAFALGKIISPVKLVDGQIWWDTLERTSGKSFNNMINMWSKVGPLQGHKVIKSAGGYSCVVDKVDPFIHHPIG